MRNLFKIKSSLGEISPAGYPTHKKKFYFFLIPDYHLPTLGFPKSLEPTTEDTS
jgi:hypothetical protein